MRYLPLILKNCWRNRRRTVLTILSIGVSLCLLGVMITLYHAFYLSDPTPDQALRLVTRNKISITVALPLSYQQRIKQVPGVQEVMVANWFQGTFRDNRDPKNQFARFTVEPEKLFKVYGEWKIPDDQRLAFERDRTGCAIGRDVANNFGFKPGDKIHLVGDIYPGDFEFTVRGIFDAPTASQLMYFNKEYVDQSLPERRRGQVGIYYVRIDDPKNANRISQEIDEIYRNSPAQTKTETEQAFGVGFLSMLGNVKMFLAAISAAVMFTILLVSGNTMAMSVRERIREIGVLKTLGFTPAAVLALVLGEACSISIAGGLIGFLISTLLIQAMVKSPFGGFLPPIPMFEASVPVAMPCHEGFIKEISPEANRQKATVQIKVKIRKPDEYLRPEMNASVAFVSDEKKPAASDAPSKPVVLIPTTAVRDGAVFVLLDGKAVKRSVKTGPASGASLRVEQGLIGGENLIVNPPSGLKDGDKVRQKS